ncbi:serine/threonine-protein kinase [Comamonas sp. JC664]|uniref:serine/threonine-protein kinase n=1 Tax=Comamonas sp. JC664 TaxID=2801917 RepID=UPI001749EB6D|nr:serine/threonine-protein kinase [Comamonas sp. JC664]MBL0694280.1 protein kinase [Comamonas sp. JC664]GHG76773.1 hypothetical protein GCM10012319_26110 [Comamonas sp. KCTC 72670]
MTSLVGRHIGRYRILEQLGSGGMSVVYKGLDTALDREVAVKVLHPHLAGKDESRRRLAREARAVAKLHHPNILEVFDFSAADAQDAFIVTEYIRGQTLRVFLDEGPMDPPELAAMVIHELAAALAHAHEAGVIHRDLKPENVMVREDGVLKLMDFGIARLMDIEERMTVTGTLVGSPAHMAPEIIEGLEAGPPADVFSVGIMFYAAMTGRLPFLAPNTTATLKRILDGDYEDPRRRVPALSDELADICATCLQRDPQRRYPDAARLRDALADYLAGLGFARVGEELVSHFADPQPYRKVARQRIVATLLERSERQLAEKRIPRALASLNQVLALDGTNERALALLKGIQRAQRLKTWRRRGIRVGVGLAAAGLLGLGGWKASTAHSSADPAMPPQPTAPEQVATTPPPPEAPTEPLATPSAPAGLANGAQENAGRPGATQPVRPAGPPPRALKAPGGLTPRNEGPPSVGGTVKAGLGRSAAAEDEDTPRKPLVRKLPVSILVRPYGSIRVDAGAISTQPLQKHDVEMTPGRHAVTISCDYCEDVVDTIDVQAEGDNVFHLRAQPKASRLSVDFEPAGAQVRVGDEVRTAADSVATPFEVRSPRGPAGFQHTVVVEVSHPGYVPERRVVHLRPGEPTTLRGSLRPE